MASAAGTKVYKQSTLSQLFGTSTSSVKAEADSGVTTATPVKRPPCQTTLSIIGTAKSGSGAAQKVTSALYVNMCKEAQRIIVKEWKLDPSKCRLQSGGAALSDHVAVSLYSSVDFGGLLVHLPCALTRESTQKESTACDSKSLASSHTRAVDTGSNDWRTNPGRLMNRYHDQFSAVLQENTIDQLSDALDRGATSVVSAGFHKRNDKVAQAEYLLAFSWSDGDSPTDGGTLYTWKKAATHCHKRHVSLSTLI